MNRMTVVRATAKCTNGKTVAALCPIGVEMAAEIRAAGRPGEIFLNHVAENCRAAMTKAATERKTSPLGFRSFALGTWTEVTNTVTQADLDDDKDGDFAGYKVGDTWTETIITDFIDLKIPEGYGA